jgi:hypothetical protein
MTWRIGADRATQSSSTHAIFRAGNGEDGKARRTAATGVYQSVNEDRRRPSNAVIVVVSSSEKRKGPDPETRPYT